MQHDAPHANRGRALANFETRFQLCWAAASVVAVAITPPGQIGALIIGIACSGGFVFIVLRPRTESSPATPGRRLQPRPLGHAPLASEPERGGAASSVRRFAVSYHTPDKAALEAGLMVRVATG